MHTCHSKLRYFDWDGQVHLEKAKTGGHQGDPLEMLIFNLTIHHLLGRVLAKFQETRAVAYTDDGYIKSKLRVTLQVLTELKSVFKTDTHTLRRMLPFKGSLLIVRLSYQLDTVRPWCLSTKPYQQRPLINKTLSTETSYQQG